MDARALGRRAMLGGALANVAAAVRAMQSTQGGQDIARRLDNALANLAKAADVLGAEANPFARIVETVKAIPAEAAKAAAETAKVGRINHPEDMDAGYKLAEKILGRHGVPAAAKAARIIQRAARETSRAAKASADMAEKRILAKAAKTLRLAAALAFKVAASIIKPKRLVKGATKQGAQAPHKRGGHKSRAISPVAKSAAAGVGVLAVGLGALYLLSSKR